MFLFSGYVLAVGSFTTLIRSSSVPLHCVLLSQDFISLHYFLTASFRSFLQPQHRTAKVALSLLAAISGTMAFRVLAFAKAHAQVLLC
jgi:hypothetical protein